jgi:hypothetical protein
MTAVAKEPIQLGNGEHWLSLAPAAGRLNAAFQARGLQGRWTTAEVDLKATGLELLALHNTLKGQVLLSDNASLGVRFEADRTGKVAADVHIEGWPFQIEGQIRLMVAVEHAQLAQLSKCLCGANQ